ncbi:MAG: GxxExxY protein [Verrucomicrobiae bacterium]|nr:GxxExxY protein [Verrucomicrobiae bacterium]
MKVNEITGAIVDASLRIHRELGPGLLESVYHRILRHELEKLGLRVESEVAVPVEWDGVRMEVGFRADLIVEGKVIVELKSVEKTAPVHRKQVITYLKLTGLPVGLLINFGEGLLKDGVHRLVNEWGGE